MQFSDFPLHRFPPSSRHCREKIISFYRVIVKGIEMGIKKTKAKLKGIFSYSMNIMVMTTFLASLTVHLTFLTVQRDASVFQHKAKTTSVV